MERFPGSNTEKNAESKEKQESSELQYKKLGKAAANGVRRKKIEKSAYSGELLKEGSQAIEVVRDHFPEDISPKEHFDREPGPSPFKTEKDFREVFDTFRQEELVPVSVGDNDYKFDLEIWPFEETVRSYLDKGIDTVKDLTGESGKLPKADVVFYLDKSARPISWFVNELWEDVTDEPKPRTEHLAIDRRTWFGYFGIELDLGEYKKGTDELATWEDIPIHDIKQEEITALRQLLKDGVITREELGKLMEKDSEVDFRVKERAIDAVFEREDVHGKIQRGEITKNEELETYRTKALEGIKILEGRERLKLINEALTAAAQLRGLFVPGGITEEDLEHPERIFDYPVDMDGKNITIVDEVERTGSTREMSKHFVSWAFPEAASVNFFVFYKPKVLADQKSSMNGQMLRIPFWYSLIHDMGTGRGILDPSDEYYKEKFEEHQNAPWRAALFGSVFLATPLDYEAEQDRRSLRIREQIARLRVEHEKGNI